MKIRTIHFVKQTKPAIYIQLYETIKTEILNGSMKAGDQLPSIRKTAQLLSISKTSVEAAYQRLIMEGYIIAKAQKGYFVDVDEQSANLRKLILNRPQPTTVTKKLYDLRSSSIDASAFDRNLWMHYIKEVLLNEEDLMVYGDPQGEHILREALQTYAYAMRGVLGKVEQVVVGASFQSLLYLICSLYDGVKCVGLETGGFPQAEQVFLDCGFTIVHLPFDEAGICIEDLAQYNLGMLYINSASCGSKHRSLRSNQRSALLKYAKEENILLIEDDHNGELRYHAKMRPAMQGFDYGKQVIYLRSFSKLLLPSLRMSFMVLNDALTKRYLEKKQNYNASASKIEQLAFAHYLLDGQLEKQVRRLRKRYERKSDVMLQALLKHFPTWDYEIDESNLQIYAIPDIHIDYNYLTKEAYKCGICLPQPNHHTLPLSFASIQEDEIAITIAKIAQIILL